MRGSAGGHASGRDGGRGGDLGLEAHHGGLLGRGGEAGELLGFRGLLVQSVGATITVIGAGVFVMKKGWAGKKTVGDPE